MKPYNVEIDVTTRWTVEVHAEDEDEATTQAESMSLDEIAASGDFKELVDVTVASIEKKPKEWEEDE